MTRGLALVPMLGWLLMAATPSVASSPSPPSTCPRGAIQKGEWTGDALHRAVHGNDLASVRRLAVKGAVDRADSYGNTALITALTPTRMLEPAGIVSPARKRALIRAENRARTDIALELLARGASANARGANGATPLTQLAQAHLGPDAELRVARRLLELGAKVDARDDFGSTALIVAKRNDKLALRNLLLTRGADRSAVNCRGEDAR